MCVLCLAMVAEDCAEDLDALWQLRTDGHRKGQGPYNASELYQMVNKMSIEDWPNYLVKHFAGSEARSATFLVSSNYIVHVC